MHYFNFNADGAEMGVQPPERRSGGTTLAGALQPIGKDSVWYGVSPAEQSQERLLDLGLSADFASPVAELERFVDGWNFDFKDPLTLARFLLGKPENLEDAKIRVAESRAWRDEARNAGEGRLELRRVKVSLSQLME
eukprot:Skav201429  [mRNA]  locus=scaffold201:229718:232564:- [translate_table: standard]